MSKPIKLVSHMGRRDRTRTPLRFAIALCGLVRSINQLELHDLVNVCYCDEDSVYHQLPFTQVFTASRPITSIAAVEWNTSIMHPPCGSWGRLRRLSHQELIGGCFAMELVDEFGGIVEQPAGSRLFKGHTRGIVVKVNQVEFGHPAMKPTILYCVGSSQRNKNPR